MTRPPTHADAVWREAARRAETERILREERERDERRRAAIEADRRAAGIEPPKPPKPTVTVTPRRAVSPSPSLAPAQTPPPAPVIPPGHVAVPADVLDALLSTHPLTKDVIDR